MTKQESSLGAGPWILHRNCPCCRCPPQGSPLPPQGFFTGTVLAADAPSGISPPTTCLEDKAAQRAKALRCGGTVSRMTPGPLGTRCWESANLI